MAPRKTHCFARRSLRWLAQRFERSWIEALNAAGYLQHIVVLTGLLLQRSPGDAAVVAAFTFRTWLVNEEHQQLLASLDLFGPNLLREDRRGLFERVLMRIERAHAAELWPEVPARVSVSNIGIEELRSVFRLCDPSERRYSPEAGPYPSLAASAASGFLMKRLFAHVVDFSPLGLRSLVEEMLAKESSLPPTFSKQEREKQNMRGYKRKRGKHSWEITVYRGKLANGKPDRIIRNVKGSARDADEFMAKLAHQVRTGSTVDDNNLTVRSYLESWLSDVVSQLAATTCERYSQIVNLRANPRDWAHSAIKGSAGSRPSVICEVECKTA